MTANKRIVLNILATYGRSLFALALGIFTGRWVLMALGEVDYGLYGLVGGLTVFIAFFNGLLASAVSRFYAFEVGRASKANSVDQGLLECQKWFNTALMIHVVVPLVLMGVGYPLGAWAVEHWLTIPGDRVAACVVVFRCVCLSCFVSMINVPFAAMYTAKQYIAELTVYGVTSNACQAVFLYYIASHPADWLTRYAVVTASIIIIPQLLICGRALYAFKECKISLALCWSSERVKKLLYFAGSLAFGGIGGMFRSQGLAILVNKYFGPSVNAAMSIANNVNGQSASLVSAMQGAFTPAIVQACGAGDEDLMRRMAFRACKFGMLLVLVFAIPLSIEIDNVMTLWLKTPPAYSAGLCLCMLATVVLDKSAVGHMIAVNAKGRIAKYQLFLGGTLILTLPMAWLLVACGGGVYSIGIALLVMMGICAVGRVWFARHLAGMSARYWVLQVVLPVLAVAFVTTIIGVVPRLLMMASFGRLCLTTGLSITVMVPSVWFFALKDDERRFLQEKFQKFCGRLYAHSY